MGKQLSKAQAIAVRNLSEIEAALIAGDWSKVRTAGLHSRRWLTTERNARARSSSR